MQAINLPTLSCLLSSELYSMKSHIIQAFNIITHNVKLSLGLAA